MAAIIEASDLVKRFDGFTAVDRISFAVPEGVIFGFLGPNGAGNVRGDHKPPLAWAERRLSILGPHGGAPRGPIVTTQHRAARRTVVSSCRLSVPAAEA